MKRQTNIFDTDIRTDDLQYKPITRLSMKVGESKEYATKSGKVITVVKKRYAISGVGVSTFFQINSNGETKQPFTSAGVKRFVELN